MNNQASRTLQEARTTLSPAEVLSAAKRFFVRRNSIYSAFVEAESATHVAFRGQGGEEIILGAMTMDGATLVSGSTYLFDQQVARFLATLPAAGAPASPVNVPAVGTA